jgi:hypothetical protein
MRIKRREKISVLEVRGGIEESSTDPYSMFLFAMRSPKTSEKCTGRLRMFFDFIDIHDGSMAERSKAFCDRAKYDNGWVFSSIVQYLQKQKERK